VEEEDDDERTRVAGSPQPFEPGQQVGLPSHLLRSGEIKPRSAVLPSLPAAGDWEEKTVVDDSQLNDPKEALAGLSYSHGGDEEFTIDEPQRPLAFPVGPSAAPKQTVHGQPPPPIQSAGDKLVVIAGNDRGREFPLAGKSVTVGRGIDNDVVLTDIAVSRKHLSIEHDGTRYKIVDAGSGNGTLINDELQTGSRPLRHGDRIEIGNTVFRFEHPAPAATGGKGAAGAVAASGPAGSLRVPGLAGTVPGPAGTAAPLPGAQNRPHLPLPRRDEAGPPGLQIPASAAPGAAAPLPASGSPPVQPAALPQSQQPLASAGPAPTPAPVMVRTPIPAAVSRPRTTALAGVPATPRNTLIGVVSALVGLTALATMGVFLGDDEYLAAENAAAASFELPALPMLRQMIAGSGLLGGDLPEEAAAVWDESVAPAIPIVPAPAGAGDLEDSGGDAGAVVAPVDGESDAGSAGDAGSE
jgi:hypothetical protein